MSNSWVVHGSRTASGRPILANDPHLAIEMPSVWWEVHVTSDTLNVAGVTIPGIPFIIYWPQCTAGMGADQRRCGRAGFFRRAARCVTNTVSVRQRVAAAGGAPPGNTDKRAA
ncbi:MAG: hypothetical protein EXQ55_05550 [Acidobacteria bacterium]|nr:hypothetical protein [Acidobacteriota bacterium]